jgi:hypothetical protein
MQMSGYRVRCCGAKKVDDKLIERIKNVIQDGNLNFLLGSGLSRPFLATLGNIELLLTECDTASIDEGVRKILRASLYRSYFQEVIQKNLLIRESDASADSVLGEYTTFLRSWNAILLHRKNTLLSKEINLFTTNIDIFLEMAFDSLSLECNDGFNGRFQPHFSPNNFKKSRFKKGLYYDKTSELPVFNLIKLHGSLSWYLAKELIFFSHNLAHVQEVAKVLPSMPGVCIDVPAKATFTDLVPKVNGAASDPSLDAFLEAYEKLLIVVNPNKEKFRHTLLNHTYYDLLRMFSNELEKENSVLFVLGFSFADEHIREITLRAANSNPTLIIYIFAYTSESKKELADRLGATNIKNKNIEIIGPEQKKNAFGNLADSFSYDFAAINERFLQPLLDRCGPAQNPSPKAVV